MSTDLDKNALRETMLQKRMHMPQEERRQHSAAIVENFFRHVPLPPPGAAISAYSPINAEVDVRDITQRLYEMGYATCLPAPVDHEQRLAFLKWTPDTKMRTSLYGIPEPSEGERGEMIPDMLIMPLLAFDDKGRRIGYGSGNFDRTFDYIKKIQPFTTVAVAFEAQKVAEVPVGAHDYNMDMVVTETGFYDFRGDKK